MVLNQPYLIKRIPGLFVLLVVFVFIQACSTLETLVANPVAGEPKIYSGVREDLRVYYKHNGSGSASLAGVTGYAA